MVVLILWEESNMWIGWSCNCVDEEVYIGNFKDFLFLEVCNFVKY